MLHTNKRTLWLALLLLVCHIESTIAFFPGLKFPSNSKAVTTYGNSKLEEELLSILQNGDAARLSNANDISTLVNQLEECQSDCGIPQPAISPQVMGRWRLLHTSNADTSSPIQRKAVDASKYQIYQDIILREPPPQEEDDNNDDGCLVVSQVVYFGDAFKLQLDALASTSKTPLAELTVRKRTGKILGLNILGVSKVGEDAKPSDQDARIDFVFDEGYFQSSDKLLGGLKVPYPVPFRSPLFRDAVKGWIDITYLSDRIRISRGNKGTTFVLIKEEEDQIENIM